MKKSEIIISKIVEVFGGAAAAFLTAFGGVLIYIASVTPIVGTVFPVLTFGIAFTIVGISFMIYNVIDHVDLQKLFRFSK